MIFLPGRGQRYPRLPLFLYGHSMGGNEVLNLCPALQTRIWRGSSPPAPICAWLFPFRRPGIDWARIADRIAPGLTQSSGLDTVALSHDPEAIKAYIHDPLVHDKITPRLFTGLRDSGNGPWRTPASSGCLCS